VTPSLVFPDGDPERKHPFSFLFLLLFFFFSEPMALLLSFSPFLARSLSLLFPKLSDVTLLESFNGLWKIEQELLFSFSVSHLLPYFR